MIGAGKKKQEFMPYLWAIARSRTQTVLSLLRCLEEYRSALPKGEINELVRIENIENYFVIKSGGLLSLDL